MFIFYLFLKKPISLILTLKNPGYINKYVFTLMHILRKKIINPQKRDDVLKMKHYLTIISAYFPKLLPFPFYQVHKTTTLKDML